MTAIDDRLNRSLGWRTDARGAFTVPLIACLMASLIAFLIRCPWNFYRTSGDVRANYGSVVGNLQVR
jgi:hypothetical protein